MTYPRLTSRQLQSGPRRRSADRSAELESDPFRIGIADEATEDDAAIEDAAPGAG